MKSLRQALVSTRRAALAAVGALAAIGLVLGGLIALTPAPAALAATPICDQYGTTTVANLYVLQNNRFGTAETQCVEQVGIYNGFQVTQADGSVPVTGPAKSYPSIYNGCYDNVCSPGTKLPMQLSTITRARTTANFVPVYQGATYDGSYHIWLDPTDRRDGVNRLEIVARFQFAGAPLQPVGTKVATLVNLAGVYWDVWVGNNGSSDVLTFTAPRQIINWDFDVKTFTNEAVRRGLAQDDWYLTSVQAGFDTWANGARLGVSCFMSWVNEGEGQDDTSAEYGFTDGGVGSTTGGSTTGGNTTTTSGSGSGSVSTIGGSSSGRGMCPYEDSPPTIGGTTTSTASGGSAGDSSTSGDTTTTGSTGETTSGSTGETTTGGSTGGTTGGSDSPSCKVTYTPQTWSGGFTANVTVANTGSSAVNGWELGFTLPPGQTVVSSWNAAISPSAGAVTATNTAYNGQIPAGGSQSFGFQGTSTGSTATPAAFTLNGTACS